MKIPSIRIALAVGMVSLMGLAANVNGADQVKKDKDDADGSRYSDKSHRSDWEKGKEELARNLKIGEDRDFYRKELEKMGYQITSINYDKPEYVEYEVVKGDNTWEVGVDLDKNSHKAGKVDVSTNMWKADTTDQVLKGNKKVAAKDKDDKGLFNVRNARFSDRDHKSAWEKGKEELTRNMKIGEDKNFYRRELQKLGYRITSTNADKPDYAEYEVVKGDRTYEVAIDFDKNSHRASKVDVGTNMWHAKGTEEALKRNQDKSQAKR